MALHSENGDALANLVGRRQPEMAAAFQWLPRTEWPGDIDLRPASVSCSLQLRNTLHWSRDSTSSPWGPNREIMWVLAGYLGEVDLCICKDYQLTPGGESLYLMRLTWRCGKANCCWQIFVIDSDKVRSQDVAVLGVTCHYVALDSNSFISKCKGPAWNVRLTFNVFIMFHWYTYQ